MVCVPFNFSFTASTQGLVVIFSLATGPVLVLKEFQEVGDGHFAKVLLAFFGVT